MFSIVDVRSTLSLSNSKMEEKLIHNCLNAGQSTVYLRNVYNQKEYCIYHMTRCPPDHPISETTIISRSHKAQMLKNIDFLSSEGTNGHRIGLFRNVLIDSSTRRLVKVDTEPNWISGMSREQGIKWNVREDSNQTVVHEIDVRNRERYTNFQARRPISPLLYKYV